MGSISIVSCPIEWQLPVWMTDPVVRARLSFGVPMISLEALIELHSLLNSTATLASGHSAALSTAKSLA